MKTITLSNGDSTLVSEEDFEILSKNKWQCYTRKRYSKIEKYVRCTMQINKNKTTILMHRMIMGNPVGFQVDHINGNTLDNRRENLRLVNNSQNLMNSSKNSKCTSKYKGVYFDKNSQKFKAQICVNKHRKHLGLFRTEIEAALCYNKNALKYFGEYARINQMNN